MDDEIEELSCMVITFQYYSIWDLCIVEMRCCESGRQDAFMHDQFGKC